MSTSLLQVEIQEQAPEISKPPSADSGAGFGLFSCAARIAFASFLLLTSAYCLLVWVPFSYFGFIHNPLLNWLPAFVRWHGAIYGLLVAWIAVTLRPELRNGRTRKGAAGFIALNAAVAVYLITTGALGSLQLDIRSYVWSMMSLLPLLWLAALDLSAGNWRLGKLEAPDFGRTTVAAVTVSLAFAAVSWLRAAEQGSRLSPAIALRGLAASLCFHLVIFNALGLLLLVAWAASERLPRSQAVYFGFGGVLVWVLLVQGLRTMVLPAISFAGMQAAIYAGAVSFAIVVFAVSFGMKLRAALPGTRPSGLQLAPRMVLIGGILLCAYAIPAALSRTDWDFVLQRVAVIAVWLLAMMGVNWSGIRWSRKTAAPVLLTLIAATAGFALIARRTIYAAEPSAAQETLDTYAGADISFKTAYDILARPIDNSAHRQFYEFLKQHTNLGPDINPGPADVRLVEGLQPAPGPKPNIFIFVIDSLRRDYVSAYNPKVDFTPRLGEFARGSIVLENAFTRYGGTALAEPAIWVGAMQLHKQYIQPFYPMNNLQKLLETDGYHSYISVDPILGTILKPSASITGLDKNTKSWGDLDLIPTLKEVQAKIDTRSDPEKPVFVYTQPQNVHTLTLERSKIPGGRKAVSEHELRRMDAALGEFFDFLRGKGLYDNSIIIVTADHGECYGEFGRYGHSDYLFPEIVRIPLIVHLPQSLREASAWDVHQVAFNTDITPSLYYLLGHRLVVNKEMFGRPLFTRTQAEQSEYAQAQYLLASSYAPVYAILSGNGQSLFIVDAVNSKNYFYNLGNDPEGVHNRVNAQLRNEYEGVVRRDLGMIDRMYGWRPPQN